MKLEQYLLQKPKYIIFCDTHTHTAHQYQPLEQLYMSIRWKADQDFIHPYPGYLLPARLAAKTKFTLNLMLKSFC